MKNIFETTARSGADGGVQAEAELESRIQKTEGRLGFLAKIVGGDFGMSVHFGKLGGGSFYNPQDCSITLDPIFVKEGREDEAEFVSGHEGGHRAITRSLEQIGVLPEKAVKLYNMLGFGYLTNCAEDCADNDWISSLFPRFGKLTDRFYSKQFEKDNVAMLTPEIQQLVALLGYTPKFVSFGSEVLRQWATGRYSEELDDNVRVALEKTKKASQDYWGEIPNKYAEERERVESARKRFQIFYERIWPELEKLIKQDVNQEKLRELAKKMLEDAKKKSEEKGKPQKKEGEQTGQGLPQKLQDELNKAMQDNLKEQLEKLGKELDKLNKQLETAGSDEEKEKIKGKIKDLMGIKEDLENGKKNAVPWDKLSEDLKKKLKEIYNKLSKEVRDELDKKAKGNLEELDDKLIKESRGKLNKDGQPLTHEEARDLDLKLKEAKETEIERKRKQDEAEKARRALERNLKKKMESGLSEYDRIYKEVAPLVEELYKRIYKIFLPQRHPRWEKGKLTGQRLDLLRVMQFQADRSQYDKLWETRTIPKKSDYTFTLMNDLSGSMSQNKKIEHDFRGKVVIAEVLNRLCIKFQIFGFQDELIRYKEFQQNLSPEIRQKMTVMLREPFNKGEYNEANYNSDGYCLDMVSKEVGKVCKRSSDFILVLSDGLPAPDEKHSGEEYDLKRIVASVRKRTKQKLVGLGIGKGTEHVADFYPTSLPSIDLKNLPRLLGDLLEDMIRFPGRYK